jgi:hypothetical protein
LPNRYRAGTVALILRMPMSLKHRVAEAAARRGVAVNRFICETLADAVEGAAVAKQKTMDPRLLLPTQGAEETGARGVLDAELDRMRRTRQVAPIDVIECKGQRYIFDGHKRVAAALILGLGSVPVVVRFRDGDKMPWGEPVEEFVLGIPRGYKHDFEAFRGGRNSDG